MRLYADVKSERASKGQGGNKFIEIELKAYDRENPVGHVVIDSTDNGTQYLIQWFPDGLDGEAEGYSDPVILREGHIEEGEIQCLRG